MELVVFNCKKCGSELDKQKDDLGVYVCKYCGFENTLDGTYDVNYVTTHGEQDLKEVLKSRVKKAGHTLYDMKLYDSSYKEFKDLYEYLPNDLFVIESLIISMTHDFNKWINVRNTSAYMNELNEYINKYKELQKDENILNDILNKYYKFSKYIINKGIYNLLILLVFLIVFIMVYGAIINS